MFCKLFLMTSISVLVPYLATTCVRGQEFPDSNQLEKQLQGVQWHDKALAAGIETLQVRQKAIEQLSDRLTMQCETLLEKYAKSTEDLFQEASKAESINLPTTSIEINSQLLANCLTELQRLEWEEAAATAELEQPEAVEQNTESELQIQKIRSAIGLAETDLRTNKQLLANLQQQREAAVISQAEFAKQAAVVERLQVQLETLRSELNATEELRAATARTPFQAAKKRLAEAKSREKIVLQQLKQLQTRELALRQFAVRERALGKLLEQAGELERQLIPLQLKLHENEVILKLYQEEFEKRKAKAAAEGPAKEKE